MLDYDVVIIGGNITGRWAAQQARKWRARVALVEGSHGQLGSDVTIRHESYYQAFLQGGKKLNPQGNYWQNLSGNSDQSWPELGGEIFWAADRVFPSLTQLISEGIDVILGLGEFQLERGKESEDLVYFVNQRKLYSRAFLVALGSLPKLPPIEGLMETGYYTRQTLYHLLKKPKLPKSLIIIGGDPSGLEMAQILGRLGCKITVIVKGNSILPREDPEVSLLIQAQMEAEGISILTEMEVTQARQIDGKKWVQAGDLALETDEIILAVGWQMDLSSLDPLGWSVTSHQTRQTHHRKIYAFSEIKAGYIFPQCAEYKAMIALKNILFFPFFKFNVSHDHAIPWAIFMEPELGRVGLTAHEVRKRYREEDFLIVKQSFKTILKAQIRGEIGGFCQVIIHKSGKILGATIVGNQGSEMISILALAIDQGIKIHVLARSPMIPATFAGIIHDIAQEWIWQSLQRQKWLYNFLDNFFHWRRSGLI